MTHNEYLKQLEKMPFAQYRSVIDNLGYYKTLALINGPSNIEVTDEMVEKAYINQKEQLEQMKKRDGGLSKEIGDKLEKAYRILRTREGREQYAKLCEAMFMKRENDNSIAIASGEVNVSIPKQGKMRVISSNLEQTDLIDEQKRAVSQKESKPQGKERQTTIREIIPKQEDTVEEYKTQITQNFRQQIQMQPLGKSRPRKKKLTNREIAAKNKFRKNIESITLNPDTWEKNDEEER